MKKILHTSTRLLLCTILLFAINQKILGQSFPTPGMTLPAGKTIVITYEVDVNANACPTGTSPAATDISNQSNVSGTNFATVQTDDPDIAGPSNPTLTPFSTLTLGDLVYQDNNRNGVFDAGDAGINGVLLNLYADNGDNVLTAADGPPIASTSTAGGGLYSFAVCPGSYIVEVDPSNFAMGGALYNSGAPLISSPVGGAPDPNDNVNNDDNGDPVPGFGVASFAITMDYGTEPTDDGDMDANTNLTLDFGFKTPTTVTIGDVSMLEGTGGSTTAFEFIVSRNDNGEAFDLTVNTVDGTAVSPSDFTAISNGTVSFTEGGALTATITVLVNHDNIVENNETFEVVISGAPAGIVITDDTGTGTINNDDSATLTLSGGGSQFESLSFTMTATLSASVQGGFSVAYATNDGTATTADNDYIDNDGTLNFVGNAGETQSFIILTTDDNKVELDETFTAVLGLISGTSTVQNAAITISGSPQTGTILNDDAAGVSIVGNINQPEANSPQTFSVSLSNPVDASVTVLFSTSDNTATVADNDYNAISNQLVTFAANTTTSQTVSVIINDDNKVEADEIFNVEINGLEANGRDVSLITATATGTILNDDNSEVTLSGGIAQDEGNTGSTSYVFTATLSNPVQGGFMVQYSTNDGTATIADNDYTDNDGTLTFAGNLGEAQQITVLVNGDLDIEDDETFTVTLNSLSGAVNSGALSILGSPQTGTILNDELDWGDAPNSYSTTNASNGARHALSPGGLTLGASVTADLDGQPSMDADADSDDGVSIPAIIVTGTNATIIVNASGPGLLNAWVDFNADGDWDEMDEQIFTDQVLAAGNNTLDFAVPAGAVVGPTFARFRLSTASGLSYTGLATDGEVEDYLVNIQDVAISIDDVTVTEGNTGTVIASFTVSLNNPAPPGGVTFDIATADNTASSGSNDYIALSLTGQTIPEGETSYTFNVTVNGDIIVEDNETFFVNITNVTGAGVADGQGICTINNDDSAILTLSGGGSQVEGTSFTMTATLSAPVQGGFAVAYSTNDGTATIADNDYTDNDGMLTFAGNTSETQSFVIQTTDDNIVELDETFTAILGAVSSTSAVQIAAITIAGSPQTGTILNDDSAVISILENVSQVEANSPQVFTVTLSNPVDVPVTVEFSTADNTATTADMDYTGIVAQVVSFAALSTTAQIVNVSINDDNKVEADETFDVSIGNLQASGRNVSPGNSTGVGTILNDDSSVVTLSGGTSQNEGNLGTTPYTFTATLSNPVQGGLTVNYSTNDGTATTADNDYQDNDGTIDFIGTMNESHNIIVLVNGDLNIEFDETFEVVINSLSAVVNLDAVTIAGSPQIGTILNDELDFGDAPDPTYPTLLASNGARHTLTPGSLRLGATVDADLDGQPNSDATGDGADEDGVILPSALVINTTANITVNASGPGLLNAWVDYNRDGDWSDAGEQIFTNHAVVAGDNALSFAVPGGATLGNSFARFRISTASGLSFTGQAADGEVEDYAIEIVNTQFSISDPTVIEGNAGTVNLVYEVSRNVNVNACSVDFAITGGTATVADSDYQALAPGTLNFSAGGAFSQTIIVVVNGDTKVELDETVEITLSNPVDAGILKGLGIGTIVNDDAATISINSPSIIEGNSGTSNLVFTISLSNPVDVDVEVDAQTLDGLATLADLDYVEFDETITILANTLSQMASVEINGDCTIEADEDFALELTNIASSGRNVIFSGGGSSLEGTGTILNDDVLPEISCPANNTYNTDPGECAATITLDLPTIVGSCGSTSLDFRYRSIDELNIPTSPYSTYAPSANNTVFLAKDRYEVEWRLTDGSGEVVCTYFIEIFDMENPSITCPETQTIYVDQNCEAILPNYSSLAIEDDNCGGNTILQSPLSGSIVSEAGTEIITLTVTDENGNSSSCTFNVTKIDTIAPIVLCQNDTVNFNGETTLILTPADLVNASDNCGIDTIAASPATVHISQLGQTVPVTLTVTDESGNSANCISQVYLSGLPPGWSQNSNGINCQDGNNAEYAPATQIWTMSSTGCFYGPPFTSDELAYAQYTLCGNGEIIAQVTGIYGDGLGWAGVSMRETSDPGSKKVQLATNLSNFVRREVRSVTGGQAVIQQLSSPNRYWLKLVRSGNQFIGYTSSNGWQWYQVMVANVTMNSCIQLGLVLTNYNISGTVNATFANVSTVGNNAPPATIPSNLSLQSKYDFAVYPNPSNGEIQVDLGDYASKEVRLELIDTYGRIVYVKDLDIAAGTESIDLYAFSNGIYFLKARSPGIPDNIKKVILLKN